MQVIGIFLIFGLLVLSVWSIARPPWAFALLNLMFPIKQVLQGYMPVLVQYGGYLSLAIVGIAAMAVAYKSTRKTLTVAAYFNPVTWCTLTIYGMSVFALLYTPARESAINMFKDSGPYMFVFVLVYPFLLSSLEELRRGIFLTVVLGCVVTVCFFFNPSAQWQGGRFIINLGQQYGVTDFTSNPLALADTGGMMMICAVLMNFRDKGRLGIFFTVAGLMLGLGLAIVSGSRGQIIFAVIVSVAMYPIARKIKDAKQFLLVGFGAMFMLGLVALTFSLFLEGEAARRWSFSLVQEGSADRQQRFGLAMGFYFQNPTGWLLGNGTNSFAYFMSHSLDYPHNLAAELLLDYGIVGLALGGIATYYTYKNARKMISIWGEDPIARGTVAAWIGVCMFGLMTSMKQGGVVGQPVPFMYWIVLAKILGDEIRAARARGIYEEEREPELYDAGVALEYGEQLGESGQSA